MDRLHRAYARAAVDRRHVAPRGPGERIGHFGFFADRSREELWIPAVRWLREKAGEPV